MKNISLRGIVDSKIQYSLGEFGFRKRKIGIFTRNINEDFLGWVRIPLTIKDGVAKISPVIGLRHQKTHELVGQLLEDEDFGFLTPTISIGLGFLLPSSKWQEWTFEPTSNVADYQSLANTIDTVCNSFFSKNAQLDRIEILLENLNYVRSNMDAYERIPVVKYLNGDKQGALEAAEKFAQKFDDPANPNASTYRDKYLVKLKQLA